MPHYGKNAIIFSPNLVLALLPAIAKDELKVFDHIAFRFPSWFSKKAVMLGPPFSQTRFKPVGAVGYPMAGNGIKQLLVSA